MRLPGVDVRLPALEPRPHPPTPRVPPLPPRVGVYVRLPGVDVESFSATLQNSGLMSYFDSLSGGSISKVGIFSLGIIPYINASIVLQLLTAAFPSLKKMQREEGAQVGGWGGAVGPPSCCSCSRWPSLT